MCMGILLASISGHACAVQCSALHSKARGGIAATVVSGWQPLCVFWELN